MLNLLNLIKKSVRVWRQASKDEKLQNRTIRNQEELEFLPAAIEVSQVYYLDHHQFFSIGHYMVGAGFNGCGGGGPRAHHSQWQY